MKTLCCIAAAAAGLLISAPAMAQQTTQQFWQRWGLRQHLVERSRDVQFLRQRQRIRRELVRLRRPPPVVGVVAAGSAVVAS